jgi:predicted transcriptional regulator
MNAMAEAKIPVCLSIAPQHLQALDCIAEQMERSRSWVAARAFESFLAPHGGEQESGAAVGAQDVAKLLTSRNAAPGPSFPGAVPFSESADKQMANYTVTPEAAPHVRATLDLHTATLARAGERARQVAAEQARQKDAVHKKNLEFLEKPSTGVTNADRP